jgi:hypothetical protein
VKIKQIAVWLLPLILLSTIYLAYQYLTFSYTITAQGIVFPYREWTLAKTADGNLINSLKNNYNNTITNYTVTEFQRGDMAEFGIREEIFRKAYIEKDDTIGLISSNTEVRRLLELEGELNSQHMLLAFYASGEKPEEVQVAYDKMILARQQYETQDKINQRNKILFERGHIPAEEYEISENEFLISYQNYLIARSQHESLLSGAKSEQLDYIRANISSLEQNIAHLKGLIDAFTITSPISGKIIRKQGMNSEFDAILRVADTTRFVVIIPVELYNIPYIEPGQMIDIISPMNGQPIPATVVNFDSSVQTINQRQHIFVSALINAQDAIGIFPDMRVDARIPSGPINLNDYVRRFLNEIYNN